MLQATALRLKRAFINQPVEVPALRPHLAARPRHDRAHCPDRPRDPPRRAGDHRPLDRAAEITLTLDRAGRIEIAFAPDRPRSATAPHLPTPWRGRFWDYRLHDGRWIPFAGEVAWEIDGVLELYWQAVVESWSTT